MLELITPTLIASTVGAIAGFVGSKLLEHRLAKQVAKLNAELEKTKTLAKKTAARLVEGYQGLATTVYVIRLKCKALNTQLPIIDPNELRDTGALVLRYGETLAGLRVLIPPELWEELHQYKWDATNFIDAANSVLNTGDNLGGEADVSRLYSILENREQGLQPLLQRELGVT